MKHILKGFKPAGHGGIEEEQRCRLHTSMGVRRTSSNLSNAVLSLKTKLATCKFLRNYFRVFSLFWLLLVNSCVIISEYFHYFGCCL